MIDIGPEGRNLFVSREKQMQDRSARRVYYLMRVVLALAVTAAAVGLFFFVFAYLVPYFREELTVSAVGPTSEIDSSDAASETPIPTYDEMGLPVYEDEFCLFSISSSNPQGAGFVPETVEVGGVKVEKRIADAVRGLISGAKAEGLALTFSQGYVSFEEQEKLFEKKVRELQEEKGYTTVMARTEAQRYVPMAGQCDDQTGLCLKVAAAPATFSDSKTYVWLKNNMGKYGFVFRYPEYKADAAGHEEDPTVIRYVGSTHAQAMQQRSMCLEEYLNYLGDQ